MELLTAWHQETGHSMTADRVMEVTGAKRASLIVNNLGKRIAGFLEVDAGTGASVIAEETDSAWMMKPELAEAMSVFNGVESSTAKVATKAEAKFEKKVSAPKAAEEVIEELVVAEGSLESALVAFDKETIQKAYPNTPAGQRLLKPAMIKALVETRPANVRTYQRVIAADLRKSVSVQESKMFLNKVLGLLKK
ncbi:hypothetical protein EOPP23_00015 [Endozoicomonas sp. OPT23]|nr:hypothetical protein [Endozoicomonas sp. OPT23]